MLVEVLLAIVAALLVAVALQYVHHLSQLHKYPAGPFPWPVIGSAHLLGRLPHEQLAKLAEQYGNPFSISLGMQRVVVIGSIETALEALVKRGTDFAGRPTDNYLHSLTSRGYQNIVFADFGPLWKRLRRLAHKAVSMVSEKGKLIEEKIVRESEELHSRLYNRHIQSQVSDLKHEFGIVTANTMCGILFNVRYDIQDKHFRDILLYLDLLMKGISNDAAAFFPWLRFIPPFRKNYTNCKECLAIREPLIRRHLLEHQASFDPNNVRDFLDALLKASSEEEQKSRLTVDQLEMTVMDLLSGGTDTTAASLSYAVLFLAKWPENQKRIFDEIQQKIDGCYPSGADRRKLPYMSAFLHELTRYSSIAPLGVPHKTVCSSVVAEMAIPKDTTVLINQWAINRDKRYYGVNNEFRPERWLNEEGEFETPKNSSYLVFSAGRRVCLGESLAKLQLFLVLGRLVRDFKIVPADNDPLEYEGGELSLVMQPPTYHVNFVPRNAPETRIRAVSVVGE